ncbi:MAG: cytidylate kinase family protein [Lentisphaeria bacterium]|jgi:cytidylate kinase|nr:cytidylate kinase family protein [Lentisphaeria bacterium]MDY0175483.1 cytidylate kinase family protein [Lentisphaeria bacterium]NLZ59950.1 BON domain-containing protein [Lentisphaerota bacterium]
MTIVSIAREMGSLGEEIGAKVAELLQASLLDKEFLEKRCCDFGTDLKTLERYDEKKPGFFASFSSDQDFYLHMLKAVLYHEAAKSSCVILGRGGNYLLKALPNCLRVRIIAPKELRVARVAQQEGLSEDKALKLVNQSDRNRAGFYQYHFNMDWRDQLEYHAVINTEAVDSDCAAFIVKSLCERLISPEDERKGLSMINNRILAQKVAKTLLFDKELPIQFLEVQCQDGKATLFGVCGSDILCRQAKEAALEVEGISEVVNRIQIIREQPFRRM